METKWHTHTQNPSIFRISESPAHRSCAESYMYGVRKLADGISTSSRRGQGDQPSQKWGEGYGTELGIVTYSNCQMDPNGSKWARNVLGMSGIYCIMYVACEQLTSWRPASKKPKEICKPFWVDFITKPTSVDWDTWVTWAPCGTLRLAKKQVPVGTGLSKHQTYPPNMYQEYSRTGCLSSHPKQEVVRFSRNNTLWFHRFMCLDVTLIWYDAPQDPGVPKMVLLPAASNSKVAASHSSIKGWNTISWNSTWPHFELVNWVSSAIDFWGTPSNVHETCTSPAKSWYLTPT